MALGKGQKWTCPRFIRYHPATEMNKVIMKRWQLNLLIGALVAVGISVLAFHLLHYRICDVSPTDLSLRTYHALAVSGVVIAKWSVSITHSPSSGGLEADELPSSAKKTWVHAIVVADADWLWGEIDRCDGTLLWLALRNRDWQSWSEGNPDDARLVWPTVLKLADRGRIDRAGAFLQAVDRAVAAGESVEGR